VDPLTAEAEAPEDAHAETHRAWPAAVSEGVARETGASENGG
jgi:hypothetical protein